MNLKETRVNSSIFRRRVRDWVSRVLIVLVSSITLGGAWAQSYPSKPVRMIVPFGTSSIDIVARGLSRQMTDSLGQPVYVENMPGAGSIVGTRQLVQAPKDGHTIMLVNNALAINPSIVNQMPYDSTKDITPIGVIGQVPLVLLVNPSVPAQNVSELIALAMSKPGGLTYGTNGRGTIIHLSALLFAHEASIDIRHVPYKDGGQMYADLLAGRIDFAFTATSILAPQVHVEKLLAFAVTAQARSKILPDVPTMREAGLTDYLLPGWMVMVGPASLPASVVERLRASFKAALDQPQMKEVLAAQDLSLMESSPQSTAQFIQSEVKKYEQLVREFNVTIE